MAAALTTSDETGPRPLYRARDVARLLAIAPQFVYALSREQPERIGALRFGRAVRFRPEVVDALVRGEG